MRVSTALIHQQGVQNILQKQADLLKVQDQLSTGKRITSPSDDPSGVSRIIDLNEALSQIEQYNENASYATQRLNLEEATLNSSTLVLQRVRELAVQAGNVGSNDIQSGTIIASEIQERLNELFDYANTRDENGDFIFSGFQSKTQAFSTDGVGNYFYNGDEGQLAIQIGSNRQVLSNDSGAEIFQSIRLGNGDFSVDANTTNGGTAKISTGSVVTPSQFQAQDFSIVFDEVTPVTDPAAFTYSILNNTTGALAIPPTAYNDGGVIAFNGVEVEISGTPVDGDIFTVNASRNQDVFTTLDNLVTSLSQPGNGNVRGIIGGNFTANGFDAVLGDSVTFDIDFDGVNLSPITVPVGVGDSNNIIAQSMLDAIGLAAGAGVNNDGSYTVPGNTPGKNVTFRLVGDNIEFITQGGTSTSLNEVQFSNLADAGNDAFLDITASGSSIITQNTLDASIANDSVRYIAGSPHSSMQSQQIDNALNNINRVMDSIINVQTSIGGRINSIESQEQDNEAKAIYLQEVRSEIEDLDFAEAISQMTFQTTALQVAQQTFVRIQGLSLFEFI